MKKKHKRFNLGVNSTSTGDIKLTEELHNINKQGPGNNALDKPDF